MTPTLLSLVIPAVTAFVVAAFSTWLTIKLSQRKFRAERLWDRKAAAYERLIEAFHKSKKFSVEHLRAEQRGREVPEERDKELRRFAHDAMEEIKRAADIGSFSLSQEALRLLLEYEVESSKDEHITSWYEHLEFDFDVTNKYLGLLLEEAKRDLQR